jgi:hypothetical protein
MGSSLRRNETGHGDGDLVDVDAVALVVAPQPAQQGSQIGVVD